MTVAILGRVKWDWGKGYIVVIRVDDSYFVQCEQCHEEDGAGEASPESAMEILTRRGVKLTTAGRAWMKEQGDLRLRFEIAEKRKAVTA